MSLYNQQSLDELSINCPNPKCTREIEITIGEIIKKQRVRCSRCQSEIEFNHSVVHNLKSESAKIEKMKDDIMRNAKINIRG